MPRGPPAGVSWPSARRWCGRLNRRQQRGPAGALRGETDIFIYPGYRFRAVDALLTNFHLPGSTLLMLACAFGGTAAVLAAYRHAVAAGYRFYSYGDAMFVLPAAPGRRCVGGWAVAEDPGRITSGATRMSNPASPTSRPAESPSPTAAPSLLDWTTLKARFRRLVIGPPRDPMAPETRHHITLIAFPRLGRPRRRRPVIFELRSGGGVQGARRSHRSGAVSGDGHGDHGVCHRPVLQPGYRAVPDRWRRLQGRHAPARAALRLVSGAALVVDYVLTIAISIAHAFFICGRAR